MSDQQADAFSHALVANAGPIRLALSRVDVKNGECSRRQDRDLILGAIDRKLGCKRFNLLISKLMSAAVADEAHAAVERQPADERATNHELLLSVASMLQVGIACFMD